MSDAAPAPEGCERCSGGDPPALRSCPTCVSAARIEASAGFRQIAEYLAAWAAFDEWCRSHGRGSAAA
jgi:hypothetical protein